jgi:hypothetical protein
VPDRVRERLAQRGLDLELLAARALHLPGLGHHFLDGGRERLEPPRHQLAKGHLQRVGIELTVGALVAHGMVRPG